MAGSASKDMGCGVRWTKNQLYAASVAVITNLRKLNALVDTSIWKEKYYLGRKRRFTKPGGSLGRIWTDFGNFVMTSLQIGIPGFFGCLLKNFHQLLKVVSKLLKTSSQTSTWCNFFKKVRFNNAPGCVSLVNIPLDSLEVQKKLDCQLLQYAPRDNLLHRYPTAEKPSLLKIKGGSFYS